MNDSLWAMAERYHDVQTGLLAKDDLQRERPSYRSGRGEVT